MDLADAQAAFLAATNDSDRAKYHLQIGQTLGDYMATHKEWRDQRQEDGL